MRKHITKSGESFDLLALKYLDDETLASEIIKLNPQHCGTLIFDAGIELSIPEISDVAQPDTLPPWRR